MITITVKQPWASLIVEGIKPIENRTWECPEKYIGERVLIHASGIALSWNKFCNYIEALDCESLELQKVLRDNSFSREWLKYLPLGQIVGSVEIVDCIVNHPSVWAEYTFIPIDSSEGYPPKVITYNWVLANPITIAVTVEVNGISKI